MNNVSLIGRLTRNPELKRTQSDMAITNFTLAVDNRGKDNGASFIPIICFDTQAENVAKCLKKGALAGVSGRINQRTYENRNGDKISVIEVIADRVQFLEPKPQENREEQKIDPSIDTRMKPKPNIFLPDDDDNLPF